MRDRETEREGERGRRGDGVMGRGGDVLRALVCVILICCVADGLFAQTPPARKKNAPPPDALVSAEETAQLEAVITTELGVIRFEFFADKAPKHVQQFIKLARSGFYDGSA